MSPVAAPSTKAAPQVDPIAFFSQPRLHIVAGKGGVGRTTLSAALAIRRYVEPRAGGMPQRDTMEREMATA